MQLRQANMIAKHSPWMIHQSKLKQFTEWLVWVILPGKCVLCGKWKLGGITPHQKCEDYELAQGYMHDKEHIEYE